MGRFTDQLRHAWNAFRDAPSPTEGPSFGGGSMALGASRPHVAKVNIANERSIIASVYATIAVDVADIELRHAMVDDEGGYVSTVEDGLQYCFSQEANLDQASRAFRQNVAMMILDKGSAAVVPVETTGDPVIGDAYEVKTMRVGEILQWYPQHVKVRLYDDRVGMFKDVTLPKRMVAIIENPFYAVMNEPNSTLQRLINKLNLMDVTDQANSSGKLDMIIQLPFTVRSEQRRQQAEQRRQDIEFQLATGKYGIAYADATEKITQLNRPVENDLHGKVERLTKLLFSQLGLTEEIMNGTADEAAMTNYMSRTVEPIVDAIAEEFQRKFLSKTARRQKHRVMYFRDPFKLIPITRLAEITDVMSRNEIFSPNDIRKFIGVAPSKDPKANDLHNSNMPLKDDPSLNAPRRVQSEILDPEEAALDAQMKELEV